MSVYKAMASVMDDLSKVGVAKDSRNQQQGFMYRGVDSVMNALAPSLAKHGLLILPRVTHRELIERVSGSGKPLFFTTLHIEYDFVAAQDGSKHTVGPIIGEAMDSGDKSANKAMAIAYKYACFQAFCIPTEAMPDPDAETHDVDATPKQLTPAQTLGKQLVEALAVGIDQAIADTWAAGQFNKSVALETWALLTAEEQKGITAAIGRVTKPAKSAKK